MAQTVNDAPTGHEQKNKFRRVAIAQIDYNPAFTDLRGNYLKEPWPQIDKPLPFIELVPSPELGLKLSLAREAVAEVYTRVLAMRVDAIISWCAELKVDLLVFPEYSIPPKLLPGLSEKAAQHGMVIVAGTHSVTRETLDSDVYDELQAEKPVFGSAVAPVLGLSQVELIPKLTKSPWEHKLISPIDKWKPLTWDSLSFVVLICKDLLHEASPERSSAVTKDKLKGINFLVVPALTPAHTIPRFQARLEESFQGYHRPAFFANCAFAGGSRAAIIDLHQDGAIPVSFKPEEQGVLIWDVNLRDPTISKPTGYESAYPARWVATANLLEIGVIEGSVELRELAERAQDVGTFLEKFESGKWRDRINDWLKDTKTPPAARKRLSVLLHREEGLMDIEYIRGLVRDVKLSEDIPSLQETRYALLKYAAEQMFEIAREERYQKIEAERRQKVEAAVSASTSLQELAERLEGCLQPGWEGRVPPISPAGETARGRLEVSLVKAPEELRFMLFGELINYPDDDVLGTMEPVQRLARLGKAQGHSLRGVGKSREDVHFLWWKGSSSGRERVEVVLDTAGEDAGEKIKQFRQRLCGAAEIEVHWCSEVLRETLQRELKLDQHARVLKEEFDNDETGLGHFYIPLDAFSLDESPKPVEQLLDEWLASTVSNFLVLLGGYGSGKTTVTRKLARDLAEAYLREPQYRRAPVRLDLRVPHDDMSPEGLIRSALVGAGDKSSDLIRLAIEEGLLVIILDGFDEMISPTSEAQIIEHFLRFTKLVRGHRAKILLTSRSNYFASDRTLSSTLQTLRGYRVAELRELDDDKTKVYLERRVPDAAEALENSILESATLRSLSKQPLLLNMVVEVRDSILGSGTEDISQASLFGYFVDGWIRHSGPGSRAFNPKNRRGIMKALARQGWDRRKESLGSSDILKAAAEIDDPEVANSHDFITELAIKTRAATFLASDGEGGLRFTHKSFLEYFLALDIYERLESDRLRSLMPQRYINEEVARFLGELIESANSTELLKKLVEQIHQGETVEQRAAALVASYRLHARKYSKEELRSLLMTQWGEGLDLRGASFAGLSMPFLSLCGADLTKTSFAGADVSNGDFSRAVLRRASLENFKASDANFQEADLIEANLESAILTGGRLNDCALNGATLAGAHLEKADFTDAKLNRAVVRDAKLVDTVLSGVDATEADFRHALFLRVKAVGLILEDANLSGVAFHNTDLHKTLGIPLSTHKASLAPRQPKGLSLPQPPWRGGGGTPFSVAWSPNGSQYAVGSWDRSVRIFDAMSGRLQHELFHQHGVRVCHFSRDGKLIVTGCSDGKVRFYETSSGEKTKEIDNTAPVISCALSHDDKWLVTGSVDKKARIYDVASQECRKIFEYESSVTSCAFSPDSKKLAIACSQGAFFVYDTSNDALNWKYAHPMKIRSSVFSPDGSLIASCCVDGKARLFRVSSGSLVADLPHEGPVWACAFSSDSSRLLTGADDGVARLFKVETHETSLKMEHGGWVWGCAFSPDGKQCLTSCDDGKIRLYDITSGQLKREVEHGRWVRACAISKSGKYIVAACSDAKARLFDATNGRLLRAFDHGLWVRACDFSPDEQFIVTGCGDGVARVFEVKAESDPLKFQFNYGHRVRACAFSPKHNKLLTGCGDGKARLYDLPLDKSPVMLEHGSEIWTCAFSPTGDRFLTGCASGLVRLYDTDSTDVIQSHNFNTWVRACAFSPDGKQYITGCRDGRVRVYDVMSPSSPRLIPHRLEVWACAVSSDGKKLVTSSGDCVVRLYDFESLALISEFSQPGWTWSCKFSPDSSKLFTCCDDGRIRIYDIESGELILTIVAAFPLPHGQSPAGYISLPRDLDISDCEVACRNAAYPLSLLIDILNRPDLVTETMRGKPVADLDQELEKVFREVVLPDNWPVP